MSNKTNIEYRYYQLPKNERILPLVGPDWHKEYGEGRERLHFHNYYEVGICHEGTGEIVLGDKVYPFESGCVTVIPPSILHTTNTSPGNKARWEWMYIDVEKILDSMFNGDFLEIQKVKRPLYERAMVFDNDEDNEDIIFLLTKCFEEFTNKKYMYKEAIGFLLSNLLIKIYRILIECKDYHMGESKRVVIEPALEYVKNNYSNTIHISDLANACSISESYFRKVFTEYMNIRPLDYITFVRIQVGCDMLRNTSQSIMEISVALGYDNVTSFIRNFKKIVGMTPQNWRESADGINRMFQNYNVTVLKGWEK